MGTLDEAVALDAVDAGAWQAHADPDHESINAMFGGWTAAVCLAAVQASSPSELTPSALTVNYIAAIAPGTHPTIHVELTDLEAAGVSRPCGLRLRPVIIDRIEVVAPCGQLGDEDLDAMRDAIRPLGIGLGEVAGAH